MAKHVIVGTAGHIDHGKTALVRRLTGIDTDRLAEEKRRGITIDIGFAHLALGPDLQLGFVDVPGHERFVKNMLAGVGGIDLVVLVIAADEGIMPQTREHFDICRLLGVRRGLVALTKADLVEPDMADLVKLETEEYLTGSFLEAAPIVPVSSKTGQGCDRLREVLGEVARQVEPKDSRSHFRLPVDRVFVMKGFGSVVTGTLVSGSLEAESEVEVYPIGRLARVRGLEVHNRPATTAHAGQRTAVNLAGINSQALHRGMVLAPPRIFQPSGQIDAVVDLLGSAKSLKHRAPVHFHSGTAEQVARVYLFDARTPLKPGGRTYAQIRLSEPLLLLPGDRFILRQFSPVITIGGGRVLANLAGPWRRSPRRLERLRAFEGAQREQVLEELTRGAPHGLEGASLVARTGWRETELAAAAEAMENASLGIRIHGAPLWLIHRDPWDEATQRTLAFLRRFHEDNPLVTGAPKEAVRALFPEAAPFFTDAVLERLIRDGTVASDNELVRLASHGMVLRGPEKDARDEMIRLFQQAGLTVPSLSEVLAKLPVDRGRGRTLLQGLLREGVLVRVSEGLVFHRDSIEAIRQLLQKEKSHSDRIGVPRFKDLTGVSRKYAIPLLEYLDRQKVTRRAGDTRIIL